MTRELAKQFNSDVEQYRRSLLYFAGHCNWEEFKVRAGRLFEYVERIEASERERRFYTVFFCILGALGLGIVILLGIDPWVLAGPDQRQTLFVIALAGCGFELFFYLNFRRYAEVRMAGFRRRREMFIRNIERDFRSFAIRPQQTAA